jgi:hypothetical protein
MAGIDYRIRRKQPDETPAEASKDRGKLVSSVTCTDCGVLVCIAQTDDWPPTGVVTLHVGTDWPEPQIFGDLVLCGDCGGPTSN